MNPAIVIYIVTAISDHGHQYCYQYLTIVINVTNVLHSRCARGVYEIGDGCVGYGAGKTSDHHPPDPGLSTPACPYPGGRSKRRFQVRCPLSALTVAFTLTRDAAHWHGQREFGKFCGNSRNSSQVVSGRRNLLHTEVPGVSECSTVERSHLLFIPKFYKNEEKIPVC